MELAKSSHREKRKTVCESQACEKAGQERRKAGMFERRAEGHNEHRKVCVSPLNKTFTSTLDKLKPDSGANIFSFLCLFLFEKKLLNI